MVKVMVTLSTQPAASATIKREVSYICSPIKRYGILFSPCRMQHKVLQLDLF